MFGKSLLNAKVLKIDNMKLKVWLFSFAEARQRLTEKIRNEIDSDFKWKDMPGMSPSYDTDTDYGDLPGSDAR